MNRQLPRVCIIGGGSSGIAACKVFGEHGIPYDCFEKSDQIGGNWVFRNRNGMSSAYRSLHINTSRDTMCYSDFPMPSDYPQFPHHSQIARYFNNYVDHFGFRSRIRFNTEVKNARRLDSGLWEVTLDSGERRQYDALVVANGHHWNPQWPEPRFPGHFDGVEMHAHYYIDPTTPHDCMDKNVIVVGMGNSAMDIACELGRKGAARNCYLSIRRGTHIMAKWVGGTVFDTLLRHPSKGPAWWERVLAVLLPPKRWREDFVMWLLGLRTRIWVGRPEDYGLPKPQHRFGATHPTMSDEIFIRLGSGDILPKPNIKQLMGRQVMFEDGSVVDADVIIYCTGYQITFPFFDEQTYSVRDNEVALFKRVLDPKYPNLFFLGLIQPLCAIMPIAEQQAIWLAHYLTGDYHLPDVTEMERLRLQEYEDNRRRYVATKRHTIQINCQEYADDLRAELKRGRKRAARAGNTLPLAARAPAAPKPGMVEAA